MLIPLASVIGQEKAKHFLTGSFARGRTSHAFLFRGPAGVGKKTTAQAFAAYINCHSPPEGDICGSCLSCLKYASGNHPDFIHLEPQGAAIRIDQIRELKRALTYPPFEARYRVILITDIHQTMRRKEVTNSILKTLEEPPDNTIFILTGDEAGDILPTILSRCQIIAFYPLPYDQVARVLISEGVDGETAATLSAISEGSLGRARLLVKEELLSLRKEIVHTLVNSSADHPQTVTNTYALAEKAANLKDNLDELLDLLTIWIRDLLLAGNGLADKAISLDVQELLPAAARKWSAEELERKIGHIDEARLQLGRNCNRTLVCEVLLFNLL